jgi:ABC-type transport system involved in cytochrome c biogenesis permease subunit
MQAFELFYFGAAGLYAAYALFELFGLPGRRWPLGLGVLAHTSGFVLRALAIDYFPLTNKFESFYAFSLAVFVVCLLEGKSPSRVHRVGTFLVGAAFYALTASFERAAFFPPPLMITLWYPLHVPASFLAYALFTSAAAAGVAVLLGDERAARAIDRGAFWGFAAFSVSMIFGGAWGIVAWGSYFLWDPKVIWSCVLWLFFAGYVHLRYWPPANGPRLRAGLALVGFFVMLVAYVGTSFLFGWGSHSFSSWGS